jgi:hypothetical protein
VNARTFQGVKDRSGIDIGVTAGALPDSRLHVVAFGMPTTSEFQSCRLSFQAGHIPSRRGSCERYGQITSFLQQHPWWSALWDKRHGVWRVAEDDPDSALYAESADAAEVLSYMTAHS